jgi:hypothetical protein
MTKNERKFCHRIYSPIYERRQWEQRYSRELEELYNEPNITTVIKSSRLRRAGHVVRMDENELPKKEIMDKPWRSTMMWPTKIKLD